MLGRAVAGVLLLSVSPAFSDGSCDGLFATGSVTDHPALFAYRGPANGQNLTPHWTELRSGERVPTWSGLTFALAAKASGKPQMLVLKMKWTQTGAADTSAIHLVRELYSSPCNKILWLFPFLKGATDANVGINRYVAYHQLLKKVDPDFIQFHVRYEDGDGKCVQTDDDGNGNIEQFLFGDQSQRHQIGGAYADEVAANLLSLADRAYGATAHDPTLDRLLSNYQGYSYLETNLIPRAAAANLCRVVSPASTQPGAVGDFALNTLLEGERAKRLPESEWRITLR